MTQAGAPQVNVYVNNGARVPPQLNAFALGKERNWFLVILLDLVTLGIYGLVYIYSVFEEAKRFATAKNPTVAVTSGGAAVGFMFIPFFDVVWAIMLNFKYPGLVTKLNQVTGRDSKGWAWLGLLSLVLPFLGGLAVLIIVQTKMNEVWREQRAPIAARADLRTRNGCDADESATTSDRATSPRGTTTARLRTAASQRADGHSATTWPLRSTSSGRDSQNGQCGTLANEWA